MSCDTSGDYHPHSNFPTACEDPHDRGVWWDYEPRSFQHGFWRWQRDSGWCQVAEQYLPKATPERVAVWVALRLGGA